MAGRQVKDETIWVGQARSRPFERHQRSIFCLSILYVPNEERLLTFLPLGIYPPIERPAHALLRLYEYSCRSISDKGRLINISVRSFILGNAY